MRNNLPRDARLYFFDEAAEVAILHIGLNKDAEPAVLARNFARTFDAINLRDFTQRNHLSSGRRNQRVFNSSKIFTFAPLKPYLDWITGPSFNGRCDILAAEANFDGVEHILRLQSKACHSFAVDLNFEEWLPLHPAWRD